MVSLADWFPVVGEPDPPGQALRLGQCGRCHLVQLADDGPEEVDHPDSVPPTSSSTIADHANRLVTQLLAAGVVGPGSRVLESASHGGYLHPFFGREGIETVILERSPDRARRLLAEGVAVLGPESEEVHAGRGAAAPDGFDLVIDFYLLAHLPAPREALASLASLVAPAGSLVLELDHLLPTLLGRQFDAIGHGHFVYPTLGWMRTALAEVGMAIVSATEQPVYGGALRIHAQKGGAATAADAHRIIDREVAAGIEDGTAFVSFDADVERIGRDVRRFLESARATGRTVVGYGAPARSVTFLNALSIGPDLLPFIVDRSAAKHGRAIPGCGIPIHSPEVLDSLEAVDVLVLAWNLVDEIRAGLPQIERRGGRFLVAIPELVVVDHDGRSPP